MNYNLQNLYKNLSNDIKSDNFCYRKVVRAINKWGAILEKLPFLKGILIVAIIFSSTVPVRFSSKFLFYAKPLTSRTEKNKKNIFFI